MDKEYKTIIKLITITIAILLLGGIALYSKVDNIDNNVIQLSSNIT